LGSRKGGSHFEDPDIQARIMLELIFKEQGGRICIGYIGLRIGSVAGSF
jgi:hypothetical protein